MFYQTTLEVGTQGETTVVPPIKTQLPWPKFQQGFQEAHLQFISDLTDVFPELTRSERMICTMVRASLKSDQIAEFLGIHRHTVENHRFRIRRKIGLTQEQSLQQFLLRL